MRAGRERAQGKEVPAGAGITDAAAAAAGAAAAPRCQPQQRPGLTEALAGPRAALALPRAALALPHLTREAPRRLRCRP